METFQIIDSRNFGGIETHILELCLLLKNKNIKNKVIFISKYKNNELRNKLLEEEIEYEEETILKNIEKYPNAIFHSHGYKANIYNKIIKLKHKQKTICSYHSGEKQRGKLYIYELFDKKTAFLSDKTIAISHLIKKQLNSKKTKVVYNFIFKEPNFKNNTKILNFSFVGRLSIEKNPKDFIRIANENKEKKLNFNIFGDGKLKKIIKNEDNIKNYGYTKDQEKIWNNTDVLLITSNYEGLPYILIEALSHGLIVVSYKVGEIPNIIKNKENGFLANNLEEMNDIIEKIQKLDDNTKNKIKQAAVKTFQDHFGKNGAEKFLKIYN